MQSQFTFEEALGYAQRSGVAIYSLFLTPFTENPVQQRDVIWSLRRLERLSEKTGGLSFHVWGLKSLEKAYSAIERDLRSQYLIKYLSSSHGDEFRKVDLNLSRPGLKVRTVGGYYP